MELKERIAINIIDLVNRIDRLTSGNVGHAKNQLRFQIKKVGEFVNELCDGKKVDTGDRQLTIPDVSQQRELFFAVLKWAKQADLDYPDEMLQKDFEQFTAKNCG